MTKGAKVELKARPFGLDEVTLTGGPFKHAMELQKVSLLRYEPDRLLAGFRKNAGLKPKAERYGGWESKTIAGHSLGHYLSGCSLMYKATADQRFKKRVDYVVTELDAAQQAHGDGYIGAFGDGKKIFEQQIARGDIKAKPFNLNGIWVPLYTQHKVLAGLRDAYRLVGNEKALELAKNFADWLCGVFEPLNEKQVQEVLSCEHGGINEVLADLYADTGEQKYLELSRRLYHKAILHPLSQGKDILPGNHANTQVPKLIGLARLYELTGERDYRRTARFFWDRVVNHHSYATGGHCDKEHFGPPDELRDRLSENTTETCNVYNMLKLSRHLFQWSADPEVADFIERAVYNHILAGQHPQSGRVIYNLSLKMGGYKHYQNPFGFTCCVGTGMENHQKYGRFIYFHDEEGLYVNLFAASTLDWSARGIKVQQETRFPEEQGTKLKFSCRKPTKFKLRIRAPYWMVEDMTVSINGEALPVGGQPSGYVVIDRTWKNGDVVEVEMPFALRAAPMPDDKNRVAIMYGPLVLAGDLGPVKDERAEKSDYVPVLVAEGRDPSDWLSPVEGEPNTFRTTSARPRNVTLKPFFRTHDRRYTVYWDLVEPSE